MSAPAVPRRERVRRCRERQRRRRGIYRIEVADDDVTTLIALGRLSAEEAMRPQIVGTVLSETFGELMEVLRKRVIL